MKVCILDRFCGAGGAAMGIDWMNRKGLTQSIPPAYTKYIMQQYLTFLGL